MRPRRPSCWAPWRRSSPFSFNGWSALATVSAFCGLTIQAGMILRKLLQTLDRRVMLLGRAIYFGVLSALVTSALLIAAFASALLGVGHGAIVAIMFVLALALLMTCLVNLALEIRIQLATIGLD